ncbi:MAG: hypothetical protein ACP5PJ_07215 [Acidimicrobiales bacterium]
MDHDEFQPPRAKAKIVYLGPVAPHWDVVRISGDTKVVDEFRMRVLARLLMLPAHDPQFRRNRERVVRDAERDGILLQWEIDGETIDS